MSAAHHTRHSCLARAPWPAAQAQPPVLRRSRYFLSSWVVLNVWTIYAAVVSRHDRSSPAITSWAIVNLQTGLMFNFYRIRCLTTEELLITVSRQ
jgi:hypothetical protein